MRIVSGTAGGRRLRVPDGTTTRPTSDRVREALFSALEARDALDGAAVLDLFAGSGALGLEALSRGAASAVFVDSSKAAVEVIKANCAAVGAGPTQVVPVAVLKYLAQPPRAPQAEGSAASGFDVVFIDPPYAMPEHELGEVLTALGPWLSEDAWVIVERSRRDPEPTWPADWEPVFAKNYGETKIWCAGPA